MLQCREIHSEKPTFKGKVAERENARKQKARLAELNRAFLNLAPPTGLEPVTYGLTVRRSTD